MEKSFAILFTPEARDNVAEALSWYKQYGSGICENLQKYWSDKIESLQLHLFQGSYIYKNFRAVKIKKFPFNVIYKISESQIQVIAILHHSRNPQQWKKRI